MLAKKPAAGMWLIFRGKNFELNAGSGQIGRFLMNAV